MNSHTVGLEAQALAAYKQGRLEEAIRLFESARDSESDQAKAAELANSLSVVLLKAGRAEEALQAVQGTAETFFALGNLNRSAQAKGNLAAALEACGDLVAAEAAYREAAEQLEKLGEHEARRHTLNALAQLQMHQNRPFEAATTLQAGYADSPARGPFGSDHTSASSVEPGGPFGFAQGGLRGWLLKQLLKLSSR